jgi:hypothetical protein
MVNGRRAFENYSFSAAMKVELNFHARTQCNGEQVLNTKTLLVCALKMATFA